MTHPRTDEPDFIYFVEDGQYQDCVRQPTCVGIGGFAPNNEHGLGHGLGLAHEQQRRDRDRYVRVFQKHISPHHRRGTWNPEPFYGADISPYNYQSVMHYGFLSSKRNRRGGPPAIETIPPHMPVGEINYRGPSGRTTSITPGDADTVARMVGLTPESWTISTNPLGLTVIVDGEEVTTPVTFDWSPGSEHTLSVPSPQVRSGGRYRFGRWSDAGGTATRTVIATPDTTLYEANFVAAHGISTRVYPEGAGTVTISPGSADGYYPLRSEITMSAEPTAGSGFRFLRWEISSDYLWQFLVTHEMHGFSANPARTYAMPGLEYMAIFTQGPIFRVESNTNPVTVEINGREYRTPVSLEARSLPERMTVAMGKDFLEHDKGYRDRFRSWSDGGAEAHTVSISRTEDTILKLTVDTDYRLVTHPPLHGDGEIVTTPFSEDGFYPEGTEVRLLATAVPPRKFIGWNGDVSGSDPVAVVVMDGGKLVEAVVDLPTRELQSGVPLDVALRWTGNELDFREHYVRVPADAGEVEIRFHTRRATPGAEVGLFVFTRGHFGPHNVQHENAQRILRDGVETITIPRPLDGWPAAYFILVRGAESTGRGTRSLEGTLVARVRNTPVGVLENPQPGSFQSGVGVISGWVCEADTVTIEFDRPDGTVWRVPAAYGTSRTDVEKNCHDTDNGFGLLWNWNNLGPGPHTVRALVDGVELAEHTITVTTLGLGNFPRGLSGEYTVTDFPDNGDTTRLQWQEARQNFVIVSGAGGGGGAQLAPTRAWLGNPAPASFQSGLSVISGWVCEAETVEIVFENGVTGESFTEQAGYGMSRTDTVGKCGDSDNGFGLLWNWNKLGDGQHTVRTRADGVEFAWSTFTVTTLGEEFARGLQGEAALVDFPTAGQAVTVEWQEAQQNFVITNRE